MAFGRQVQDNRVKEEIGRFNGRVRKEEEEFRIGRASKAISFDFDNHRQTMEKVVYLLV
jgi:hypothetical protein